MAPSDKRPEPSMLAALGIASSIGFQFAAAVLLGLGLGLLVDSVVHTTPWGLLIGLLLGILAGAYGVVRLAMREMRQ